MRGLLARLLMPRTSRAEAAKLRHAKPGPGKRAKHKQAVRAKMDEMRAEIGLAPL